MASSNFKDDPDYEDITAGRVDPQDILASQRAANAQAQSDAVPQSTAASEAASRTEKLTDAQGAVAKAEDFDSYRAGKVQLREEGLAAPIRPRYSDREDESNAAAAEQKAVEQNTEQLSHQQDQLHERQRREAAQQQAAQGRAAVAAAKKARAGQISDFKAAGGVTEHDAAGNVVPKLQTNPRAGAVGPTKTGAPVDEPDKVPVFKEGDVGEEPFQGTDGRWKKKWRDSMGDVYDVDLEANGQVRTDAKTGAKTITWKGKKLDAGVDDNVVERNKLKASQLDLDRANQEERLTLQDLRLQQADAREAVKPFAKQVKTATDTIANLERSLQTATGPGRAHLEERLAEAKKVLDDPNYLEAKSKLDAVTGDIETRHKSIIDRQKQALEITRNIDTLKAARNLPATVDARHMADPSGAIPEDVVTTGADGKKSIDRDFLEARVAGMVRKDTAVTPAAESGRGHVSTEAPPTNVQGYADLLEGLKKNGIAAVGGKPIDDEIVAARAGEAKMKALGVIADKVRDGDTLSFSKFDTLDGKERYQFMSAMPATKRATFKREFDTWKALSIFDQTSPQVADQVFAMQSPENQKLIREAIGVSGMKQLVELAGARAQGKFDQERAAAADAKYEGLNAAGKVWANTVALYGGATKGMSGLVTAAPRIYGLFFQNGKIADRSAIQWADNADAILDDTYLEGRKGSLAEGAGQLIGTGLSFLVPAGAVGTGVRALGASAKAAQYSTMATTALLGSVINGADSIAESEQLGLTDRQTWQRFAISAVVGTSEAFGVGKGVERLVNGLMKVDRATHGAFKRLLIGMGRESLKEIPEEFAQEFGQQAATGIGDLVIGAKTHLDAKTGEMRAPKLSEIVADSVEGGLQGAVGAILFGSMMASVAHSRDRYRLRQYSQALQSDGGYAVMHDILGDLRGKLATARSEGHEEEVYELKDQIEQAQYAMSVAAKKVTDVSPTVRDRVAKIIGTDVDAEGIGRQLDENDALRFASLEIGRAMRPFYLTGGREVAAQQVAPGGGGQAAVDQMIGAHAVQKDLRSVLEGGKIEAGKAAVFDQLGLLELETLEDGSTIYRVTDDAMPLLPPATRDAVANDTTGKYNLKVTAGQPGALVNNLVKSGEDRLRVTAEAVNQANSREQAQANRSASGSGGAVVEGEAGAQPSNNRFTVGLKVALPGGVTRSTSVTVEAANEAEAAKMAVAQARTSAPKGAAVTVASKPVAVRDSSPAKGNSQGKSQVKPAHVDEAKAGELFSQVYRRWREDLGKFGVTKVAEDNGDAVKGPMALDRDTLLFNRSQIALLANAAVAQGLTPEQGLEDVLVHELIHGVANTVVSHEQAEEIFNTAPAKLLKLAETTYPGFEKMSAWQKGHELLRLVVEGRYRGKITEQIYKALQAVLDALGIQVAKLPDNELLNTAAETVKAALDAAGVDIAKSKTAEGQTVENKEPERQAKKERLLGNLPAGVKRGSELVSDDDKSRFEISTPTGGVKVRGRWRVVEASELTTSDRPDYNQDLQRRDRDRGASKAQIAEIAFSLDPNRLEESATSDIGSPIVNEKGEVLSGNGRSMALRSVYEQAGKKAEEYRLFVKRKADELGIGDQLDGVRNPVLVREVSDFGSSNEAEFAELSNRSQLLGRSAVETAMDDGKMLMDEGLLDSFKPGDDGDVLTAGNRQFNRLFIQHSGDRAQLTRGDGSFSPELEGRVRRAVLAAIMRNLPEAAEAVTTAIERADKLGLSRQVNGIMAVAGRLLKLQATNPDMDIAAPLAEALAGAIEAKGLIESGKAKTVEDALSQGVLFGAPSPSSQILLGVLLESNSAKAVREFLGEYARIAETAGVGPSMFDDEVSAVSPLEILESLAHRADQEKARLKAVRSGESLLGAPRVDDREGSSVLSGYDPITGTRSRLEGQAEGVDQISAARRSGLAGKAFARVFGIRSEVHADAGGRVGGGVGAPAGAGGRAIAASRALVLTPDQAGKQLTPAQADALAAYREFVPLVPAARLTDRLDQRAVASWLRDRESYALGEGPRERILFQGLLGTVSRIFRVAPSELIDSLAKAPKADTPELRFVGAGNEGAAFADDRGFVYKLLTGTPERSSYGFSEVAPEPDGGTSAKITKVPLADAILRFERQNLLGVTAPTEVLGVTPDGMLLLKQRALNPGSEVSQGEIDAMMEGAGAKRIDLQGSGANAANSWAVPDGEGNWLLAADVKPGNVLRAKDGSGPFLTDGVLESVSPEVVRENPQLAQYAPARPEMLFAPRVGDPETVQFANASVSKQPGLHILFAPRVAFHGTPHQVDRFSLDKIGTGEGAQAYGWGLYFAENKAVAEDYQKGLTERDFIRKVQEVYDEFDSPGDAVEALKEIPLNDGQRALLKVLADEGWWGFDYPHQAVRAALREPENFDPSPEFREAVQKFGNLYTVSLDAEPDELLDWDKPLREQSEKVRRALARLNHGLVGDETGASLYTELSNRASPPIPEDNGWTSIAQVHFRDGKIVHGEKAASEALHAVGIPGLQYLDQGSRKSGGTRNYVVFDESRIKITHENGRAVDFRDAILGAPRVETDPKQGELELGDRQEKKPKPYSKSSTQVNLPAPVATRIANFAKAIPERQLYTAEPGYGREDEPHVTALYGLTGEDDETGPAVAAALRGQGPITLRLGKLSLFKNEKFDVLKVDVDSPDLHRINEKLRELPHENDFPDYTPHVTIAYLKKGEGERYVGASVFDGVEVRIPELLFSARDRSKVPIPLGMPAERSGAGGDLPPAKSVAELVRENMGLAVAIADSYRNIPGTDADDVHAEARKALVTAARTFDPGQASFGSYAGRVIRNALTDIFRKEVRREKTFAGSADVVTSEEDGEEFTAKDQLEDPGAAAAVSAGVEGDETRGELDAAMAGLPENVRTVLALAGEGKSLREIGQAIGLSHEKARQILNNGKAAVEARLRERGFQGVDPDGILFAPRIDEEGRESVGIERALDIVDAFDRNDPKTWPKDVGQGIEEPVVHDWNSWTSVLPAGSAERITQMDEDGDFDGLNALYRRAVDEFEKRADVAEERIANLQRQLDSTQLLYSPAVAAQEIREEADRIQAGENTPEAPTARPNEFLKELLMRTTAGRLDALDFVVPGAKNLLTDAHIKNGRITAALRGFRERIEENIKQSFGYPSWWRNPANRERLKRFTAELLPTAARLNAVARDSSGAFKFESFWMRAGELSGNQDKAMGMNGVPVTLRPGVFVKGRHDEKLRVGRKVTTITDGRKREFWQLERFNSAKEQAAIHAGFQAKFPEAAHWLDSWIDPNLKDSRVNIGGIELPDFNRFSLRDFWGEISPFGEMGEVLGYTPDVFMTKSLVGIIADRTRNLLNRTWTGPGREYKSGEARERGQVRNIFEGFNARAAEAHLETQRRQLAEDLLKKSLKPIPSSGTPSNYVRWDTETIDDLLRSYHAVQGLDPDQYGRLKERVRRMARGPESIDPDQAEFKSLFAGLQEEYPTLQEGELVKFLERDPAGVAGERMANDQPALRGSEGWRLKAAEEWARMSNALFSAEDLARIEKLAGRVAAEAAEHKDKMIHKSALAELRRPMASQYINNGLLRIIDAGIRGATGGYLASPFTLATNQLSNELFVTMHTLRRGLYGLMSLPFDKTQGKLGLYEAGNLIKGVVTDRWYNKSIRELVPDELFDGNHRFNTIATTEFEKTPAELLRELNVSGAVLKLMRYGNVDTRAKQRVAFASYLAHGRIAYDEARAAGKIGDGVKKGEWIKDWIQNLAPDSVHRSAYNAAMLVAMDYANVPPALDEGNQVMMGGRDVTAEVNLFRRGVAPFAKFPYNLARQGKRFTFDSIREILPGNVKVGSIELTKGAVTTSAQRRQAAANLVMMSMMYVLARAMMDDDKDGVPKLGRSLDDLGKRLDGAYNTAGRINITDTTLGRTITAALDMFGLHDLAEQGKWLRIRALPYASSAVAMATLESRLRGRPGGAEAEENVTAVLSDMVSEGLLLKMLNALRDQKGPYDKDKNLSFIAGETLWDAATGRFLPPPLLRTANAMIDPVPRRMRPVASLDYDPGLLEAVQTKIPGAARNLPPSGRVVNSTDGSAKSEAAIAELLARELPAGSFRHYVDAKGKPKVAYVMPGKVQARPRVLELFRAAGLNVKFLDEEEYRRALAAED